MLTSSHDILHWFEHTNIISRVGHFFLVFSTSHCTAKSAIVLFYVVGTLRCFFVLLDGVLSILMILHYNLSYFVVYCFLWSKIWWSMHYAVDKFYKNMMSAQRRRLRHGSQFHSLQVVCLRVGIRLTVSLGLCQTC